MSFLDRLFGKKRRDKRVTVRLRVTIGQSDSTYWTEDVAMGGIRMSIGKQLSLGDLTGGTRDVMLSIELAAGAESIQVYGEPIWTVRSDEGDLDTGWIFSRYVGDGKERLMAFIESAD